MTDLVVPAAPGSGAPEGAAGPVVAALGELAALDLESLGDDDLSALVVDLERVRARLEAARSRVLHEWDRRGVWRADGARSAASWVAHRCRLPRRAAGAQMRLARQLRHLPAAGAALEGGEIGVEHVGVLAAARTPRTAEAFDRAEAALVAIATTATWPEFCRAIAEWLHHADPNGADQDAGEVHEARRVSCVKTWRGIGHLEGLLEPIGADVVSGELTRLEGILFERDWADARAIHGDDTRAEHLARTPAQRRHDALVWMAERSAAAAPDASRAPLFTAHLGLDSLRRICELADGTVVAPAAFAPWLARARAGAPPGAQAEVEVERVVFESPSRVLDVSARTRLFRGATRRAVEVRDRTCVWPGCDEPAERCEVDHLHPWALGGATVQRNAALTCARHHRLRDRGYRVHRDPDGRLRFFRPDGRQLE